MLTNILVVIAGFYALIKGADYLVLGASSIARKLGIPALVVGLTVVAFGTSAPEFFVNVFAAFGGQTDIAIGNVLGSNLANILLVLGVSAVVAPLTLTSGTVWKEIPFSLLAAVLVVVMGSDMFLDGSAVNEISRIDGLTLLGFFLVFLVYTFGIREKTGEQPQEQIEQASLKKSILFTLGGLIALSVGGQLVVHGATGMAVGFGVSQNLIALTIVALGTSLPELVTSVVAAKKGHQDLAIGNVVGSNVFNVFFVLSSSAVVLPLTFANANLFDAVAVMAATAVLFVSLFVGKRHTVGKHEGIIFISLYFVFLVFIIFRG